MHYAVETANVFSALVCSVACLAWTVAHSPFMFVMHMCFPRTAAAATANAGYLHH